MMKYCCCFLVILISVGAFAQDSSVARPKIKLNGFSSICFSLTNQYLSENIQHQAEAGVTGKAVIRSNAVSVPFAFALLGNDFIDDEMKDNVSTRLNERNAFELNYDVQLYARWLQDSFLFRKQTLYTADYSSGVFQSVQFPDDAFKTVFYGNASYAGQTADFAGTHSYNFTYDRLGFSVQKKFQSVRSHWEAGARVSLLTIRSGMYLDISEATLFTAETGEYLDASYNFELFESDSSNHGRFQVDGGGASLDLQLSWISISETSRINLYVNDLGLTVWNNNTRKFFADSSVRFEGIEINNLFSTDDSSFFHYNTDSFLNNTGTKRTINSKAFLLPACFTASYQHSLSSRIILNAGISYKPYPDLLPLIFVKPQWQLSRTCQLGVVASYGGTTNYALGMDVKAKIKDRVKIIFGSDNILAALVPRHSTSTSLFLLTSVQF